MKIQKKITNVEQTWERGSLDIEYGKVFSHTVVILRKD